MKHIIILGDGMADWPVKSLGNKTLLQYAKTPYMDKLARMGRNGRLITVAEGFHPGSEVANMSVLGYNLPKVYEGRGPLEAASIGVELADDDLALRCNLICIEEGKIKNHSCGRLETEEADVLIYFIALQDVFLYLIKVTVQIQSFADRYGTRNVCQCMKVEQGICSDRSAFV